MPRKMCNVFITYALLPLFALSADWLIEAKDGQDGCQKMRCLIVTLKTMERPLGAPAGTDWSNLTSPPHLTAGGAGAGAGAAYDADFWVLVQSRRTRSVFSGKH